MSVEHANALVAQGLPDGDTVEVVLRSGDQERVIGVGKIDAITFNRSFGAAVEYDFGRSRTYVGRRHTEIVIQLEEGERVGP